MQKKDIYTFALLILLTITSALFSNFGDGMYYASIAILLLSITKFVLITFQFMELKKANLFWKILVSSYLVIFATIIAIAL